MYFASGTGGLGSILTPITSDWDINSVTWNKAKANTAWKVDTGGGDYDDSKAVNITFVDPETWEEYDVTALVEEFYKNPGSNHGFLVRPKEGESCPGRFYISSEFEADKSLHPKLTITYETTGIINSLSQKKFNNGITVSSSALGLKLAIPFSQPYTVILTDLQGRTVYTLQGDQAQTYTIPVRSLARGIYIFHVTSAGMSSANTFVQYK